MGRTLRFVTHVNGAALHYVSANEKVPMGQYRSVLNGYLFGGELHFSPSNPQ
jgi:hypothetical protein